MNGLRMRRTERPKGRFLLPADCPLHKAAGVEWSLRLEVQAGDELA
jgi:hypothetical protein